MEITGNRKQPRFTDVFSVSLDSCKTLFLFFFLLIFQRLQEKVMEGNLDPREQMVALKAQVSFAQFFFFFCRSWLRAHMVCKLMSSSVIYAPPPHLLPHRAKTFPRGSLSAGQTHLGLLSALTRWRVSDSHERPIVIDRMNVKHCLRLD